MKDQVRVGIIGCGMRGLHHIGFNMVDSLEATGLAIRSVADRTADITGYAATELEKRYKDTGHEVQVRRPADYKAMLADPDLDFIIITSHTDAHAEHAVAAIQSGKKVYLDKPISVTLDDGGRIAEAEKRSGRRILMGFTRRYEDSWRTMKRMLDDGAVGELQMILLRSIVPYSFYMQGWHRKIEWSGGPLNDKCSHHFDVFRWMSGSECVAISAFGGRSGVFRPDPTKPERCSACDLVCSYRSTEVLKESKEAISADAARAMQREDERSLRDACVYSPENDVEDFGSINMRFRNGIVGNLFFTIFGPLAPDGESLELVGETGRLVLSRSDGMIRSYTEHGRETSESFAGGEAFESSHYGSDKNLIRHMRDFCDGAEPACTAEDGFAALRLVHAARSSFQGNGGVNELA